MRMFGRSAWARAGADMAASASPENATTISARCLFIAASCSRRELARQTAAEADRREADVRGRRRDDGVALQARRADRATDVEAGDVVGAAAHLLRPGLVGGREPPLLDVA